MALSKGSIASLTSTVVDRGVRGDWDAGGPHSPAAQVTNRESDRFSDD